MIDDVPKILLAIVLTAMVFARVWIAWAPSSSLARACRRWWGPRAWPLIVAIVALLAFLAIAEDVVFVADEPDELILHVDRFVQASLAGVSLHAAPFADAVHQATSVGLAVLIAVGVLGLLVAGRRVEAVTVLAGTLTALGMGEVLRAAYSLSAAGFPSVSAVVAVCGVGALACVLSRGKTRLTRVGLLAVAATVAVIAESLRIVTRIQGPSDVLGGMAFGSAWLAIVVGGAQSAMRLHRWASFQRSRAARRADRRPAATRYQAAGVAEAYDRQRFHGISGRYNNWRLHRLLGRVIRRLAPGAVVLDVPCGTGRIDGWLLGASFRVVATDVSTAMLTVARGKLAPRASRARFFAADAARLPLRTGSVDAVFCIRFVHLLDATTRRAALTELARVAKQWVLVEYRRVERPGRTAQRALIRAVTGRPKPPKKMRVAEIAPELHASGLVPERLYFVSRLFSGSVLVLARRRSISRDFEQESFEISGLGHRQHHGVI